MALIDIVVEGISAQDLRKLLRAELKREKNIRLEVIQRVERGGTFPTEILVVTIPNFVPVFVVLLELIIKSVLKKKWKENMSTLELVLEFTDGTKIKVPVSANLLGKGIRVQNNEDVARLKKLVIQKKK